MRESRSPRAEQPLRRLAHALISLHLWRRLYARLAEDRIFMRSGALAYETLLSIVPLSAVGVAAVRALGGRELSARVVRFVANEYFPSAAGPAVERFLPLIEGLDLHTIGVVGVLTLMPVMYSLISAVELVLSDIFRTPRRANWWLLGLLGTILTLGPLGSVLTVRYVPSSRIGVDHVLTPFAIIATLLYVVFRHMPRAKISDRAALTGSLAASFMLSVAKAVFGLYTTHLASSIHMVWGAVAFVPLMLVWVGLSWGTLLLGAELAATLQIELDDQGPNGPPAAPKRRNSRLRQRLRQRAIDTSSTPSQFVPMEGPNGSNSTR